MSLINQMLQDLEHRNASKGRTEPISGEVRAVTSNKSSSSRVVLMALVVGIFVVLALLWWSLNKTKSTMVSPVVVENTRLTHTRSDAIANHVPQVKSQLAVQVGDSALEPINQTTSQPSPSSNLKISSDSAPTKLEALPSPKAVSSKPVQSGDAGLARLNPAHEAPKVAEVKTSVQDVSAVTVAKPSPTPVAPAVTPVKTLSPTQQSDNLYRQAVSYMQQGRVAEAQELLQQSVAINSTNVKARRTLVGLMVDGKQLSDAEALLVEGLKLSPEQIDFTMMLARVQLELASPKAAQATLESGLSYADDDADYHAFYATLLQRSGQHDEAIQHYLTALKTNPSMSSWLVGVGISLQAQNKLEDAVVAFQRAKDTGQLSPQMIQFVDQRLKQIKSGT